MNLALECRFKIIPFGQETHLTEEGDNILRTYDSETSRHIRYSPDFFAVDKMRSRVLYLLEYKSSQTPLFTLSRIRSAGISR